MSFEGLWYWRDAAKIVLQLFFFPQLHMSVFLTVGRRLSVQTDVYLFIHDHVHVIILARKWGLKYRGFWLKYSVDFVDMGVLTVVCVCCFPAVSFWMWELWALWQCLAAVGREKHGYHVLGPYSSSRVLVFLWKNQLKRLSTTCHSGLFHSNFTLLKLPHTFLKWLNIEI